MEYQLNKNETFVSLNGNFSEKKTEWNHLLMGMIALIAGVGSLTIAVFDIKGQSEDPWIFYGYWIFLGSGGFCFFMSLLSFRDYKNRSNLVLGPDYIKFVFGGKVLREVHSKDIKKIELIPRKKWHFIKENLLVGPYRNLTIETQNQGKIVIREIWSNFPQIVNHIVKMTNQELTLQEKATLLVRGPHLLHALLADYSEFPKIKKDWQTKLKREGLVPHDLLPYVKQEIKNWDKL